MLFEFILFAILGWSVFTTWPQPIPSSRWMLAVIFVVLMVVWLIVGVTGFSLGNLHVPR
jgi:hypothetical protein